MCYFLSELLLFKSYFTQHNSIQFKIEIIPLLFQFLQYLLVY